MLPFRYDGDELFTFHAIILLSLVTIFLKKQREADYRLLGLCLLYALFTLAAFQFTRLHSRFSFLDCFIGFVGIKAVAEYSGFNYRTLGKFCTAWGVISLVFVALQFLKCDPFYLPVYPEIAGVSTNPWLMGCSAVLVMPFVYSYRPILCLILVPLFFLSHSTAVVGTASVVFSILLFKDHKLLGIWALCLLALIAAAFFVFFDSGVDPARIAVWKGSWPYFKHQIFGQGIGQWAHEGFMRMNGSDPYHWRWAHAELYQHLFEQGWIGLALCLAWIGGLFIAARKDFVILAGLTGILMLSLLHPVLHFGRLLFLDIVIIGIATAGGDKYGVRK